MGARRKAQKRKLTINYRRWLKLLLVMVFAVAAWQLSDQWPEVIMPIDNVKIEGSFVHLSRDAIRDELAQAMTGDYFTADIAALRTRLLAMPWVQDAAVRRQWPSTIRIRVTEKKPVAYWSDDALLSDRGELFKPSSIDRNMQMPAIIGPAGLHQKVWVFLGALQTELAAIGLAVNKLALDERRSWSMQLSNGVEVQLGRNDTEKRIERFIRVFSMQNAPNIDDIEYIDLRYPNGFALRGKAARDQEDAAGPNHVSRWNRHA